MRKIRFGLSAVALLLVMGAVTGCASTPQAGEIGVVRNGASLWPLDWFDNHNIRGHVQNGSSTSWVGLGSEVHYYPVNTQQRFYKAEACFGTGDDQCSADRGPYHVQTKDGVDLGIEGTFFVNTTFDNSPAGLKALDSFDTQFGTRPFSGKKAYEGSKGWSALLGAVVDPLAANDLRDIAAGLECAQFISSCSLVQNQEVCKPGDKPCADRAAQRVSNANNKSNLKNVQDAVAAGLADDLVNTLGGKDKIAYFNRDSIKFVVTKVDLPTRLAGAVQDAQSAFAQITQAQARIASATADAEANRQRQAGYNACSACRAIDAIKAWKGTGVTTVVNGGASVSVGGR